MPDHHGIPLATLTYIFWVRGAKKNILKNFPLLVISKIDLLNK
jgi:hypothetical protein